LIEQIAPLISLVNCQLVGFLFSSLSELLVASLFTKHFHACNSFIYQFNNEIRCGVLCYSVLRFLVNSFSVFSVLSIRFSVAADLLSKFRVNWEFYALC
jgi:hypothetical protein